MQFINADYTLTLSRLPEGPYLGLAALTHYSHAGVATGVATIVDESRSDRQRSRHRAVQPRLQSAASVDANTPRRGGRGVLGLTCGTTLMPTTS